MRHEDGDNDKEQAMLHSDLHSLLAVRVDERHIATNLDPADLDPLTGRQRRHLYCSQRPA